MKNSDLVRYHLVKARVKLSENNAAGARRHLKEAKFQMFRDKPKAGDRMVVSKAVEERYANRFYLRAIRDATVISVRKKTKDGWEVVTSAKTLNIPAHGNDRNLVVKVSKEKFGDGAWEVLDFLGSEKINEGLFAPKPRIGDRVRLAKLKAYGAELENGTITSVLRKSRDGWIVLTSGDPYWEVEIAKKPGIRPPGLSLDAPDGQIWWNIIGLQ